MLLLARSVWLSLTFALIVGVRSIVVEAGAGLKFVIVGLVVSMAAWASTMSPVTVLPTVAETGLPVFMTRFFSHLSLTANGDGSLAPFAEELPDPVAADRDGSS